jgi:hypothetical protein
LNYYYITIIKYHYGDQIREYEKGGACNTHRRKRYKILVGKTKTIKKKIRRSRLGLEYNIKMDVKR